MDFDGNYIPPNGCKPWNQLTNDYKRKIRKVHNDSLLNIKYPSYVQPQQVLLNSTEPIISDSQQPSTLSAESFIPNNHNNQQILVPNSRDTSLENIIIDDNENINYDNNNNNKFNSNSYLKQPHSSADRIDCHDNYSFNEQTFQNNLAKCLVDNKINQSQMKALLDVLRTHPQLQFLPKDPRTLVKTPREKIVTKIIAPGEYLHIGLESKLESLISRIPLESIPDELLIDFSTDGAELNKKIQIWPIQIRIVNLPSCENPELVGIYKGESKPLNFEEFFEDFVSEAEVITSKGGINYSNKLIGVKFRCFIGDAPARAYVLNHVSHVANNPCSKCKVQGLTYKKSRRYPGINHELRTDVEYRTLQDVDHHNGLSAIRKLPIDLVNDVPFDYMHLVCLGIMKKFIESVAFGKCQADKLQPFEIDFLANRLTTLQNYCPREFARIPRELDKYYTFKATEFRQLLLYTLIVVSSGIIRADHYNHFLLLHTSMRVLLNESSSEEDVNFAEKALQKFVIDAENIHGLEFLTYNSHGVLHLVLDYKRHGSLHSISAFTYENSIRLCRPFVRKPNQPLQQINKRIKEQANFETENKEYNNCNTFKAYEIHENGPINDLLQIDSEQYENLKSPKFFYSIQNNDNTIITNDKRIGLIQNIIFKNNHYFFAVRFFRKIQPFYSVLDRSSEDFGVYLCTALEESISILLFDEIKTKCYRMPMWVHKPLSPLVNDEQLNNAFVVIEMLL